MTRMTTTETGTGSSPKELREAESLLERGDVQAALNTLEGISDSSGAADALRGAACFRLERYSEAADHLRAAIKKGRADGELRRLLDLSVANHQSDIARPVPTPSQFDPAEVSGGPKPGAQEQTTATPADPRAQARKKTPRDLVRDGIGQLGGFKLGKSVKFLASALGRETNRNSPWTSWYEYGFLRGTLMLAARRERLNREQLFPAYGKREGTGFFRSSGAPPAGTYRARSADGSYNDLRDPMAGAAGTRFGFNTDPASTPGETGPRLMTPNPRVVSRVLFTRKDGFKPVPFLNLTAASWIQFMNHDWVSYGDPSNAEPYRIPLSEDDPVRRTLRQTHMLVRPTQKDPTRRDGERENVHLNEVTSWWDGSQIYGSDEKTIQSLRSHQGGKLAVDSKTGNLPVLADGVEQTGFRRNWWVGLSMLHTLFVKEHNAICDMLAEHHPTFDDQRLFDTARLINAAVMAKIHTVEWTPAVLPNKSLNAAMHTNWFGLLTNLFRKKDSRKTVADVNVTDPIAGGLVGNETDNHGVPYSLTREFLAVYRLHSLLPDTIGLHEIDGADGPVKTVGLAQTRQAASHAMTEEFSMDDLFYSFGVQHSGQLVLNNYPETLQNLSVPGAGFFDLGAVDILRDRERGVPRYNQFRRLFGLTPIQYFEDLTDDRDAVAALKQVYDSVEDIDLLVGNLAEAHRPEGFGFGETLFEVFILNASRRLQADRFFTEYYTEEVYTAQGLQWIDDATFKNVLLRHYPRLARTGLANVDNAFEPWDVGELDPLRHPLRAFG